MKTRTRVIILFCILTIGLFAHANNEVCVVGPAVEAPEITDPLLIQLGNVRIRLPEFPDRANGFSAAERETFFKRRKEILSFVAKTMNFPRALGFVSWTKNSIKRCFSKKATESNAEELARFSIEGADGGKMKQQGLKMLVSTLETLDNVLWQDFATLTRSKSVSSSMFVAASAGLSVGKRGGFALRGLQIDFGYNFESKSRFVKFVWVRESLKNSIFCAESLLKMGFSRKYEIDETSGTQCAVSIHSPTPLLLRQGERMFSVGGALAANVTDFIGLGFLSAGFYELGTAMMTVPKLISTVSAYSTNYEETTLYKVTLGSKKDIDKCEALLTR